MNERQKSKKNKNYWFTSGYIDITFPLGSFFRNQASGKLGAEASSGQESDSDVESDESCSVRDIEEKDIESTGESSRKTHNENDIKGHVKWSDLENKDELESEKEQSDVKAETLYPGEVSREIIEKVEEVTL